MDQDFGVRALLPHDRMVGEMIEMPVREPEADDLPPALLRIVHEVEGIERIRFLTSHPNYFTEELMDGLGFEASAEQLATLPSALYLADDPATAKRQLVAAVANRIQKVLEDANLKLTSAVSKCAGGSGRRMLRLSPTSRTRGTHNGLNGLKRTRP